MKNRPAEQGNILFLILIAVALFAALSFAVTQSTRSGGGDVSEETRKTDVSQILNYGVDLDRAIIQMSFRGVQDDEFCFSHSAHSALNEASYSLQPTCANIANQVFHPGGGGVSVVNVSSDWLDSTHATLQGYGEWMYTTNNQVANIGTTGAGTTTRELLAYIPYLSQTLCASLNDALGITGIPDEGITFSHPNPTQGPYAAGGQIATAELSGRYEGCFYSQTGGVNAYHFYHVLIAR